MAVVALLVCLSDALSGRPPAGPIRVILTKQEGNPSAIPYAMSAESPVAAAFGPQSQYYM